MGNSGGKRVGEGRSDMRTNRIMAVVTGAWLALVGALAAPGSARAEEEGVFMKDILGTIGIIEKDKPPIQYRERAPLVVPPRLELREPVNASAIETRNPQWPNDPDMVEKRRRAADAKIPITEMERRRALDDNPRMTTQELQAGRRPGAGVPTGPVVRHGDSSREDTWVNPELLRNQGKRSSEPLVAGVEPDRKSLSEPPSGLRKAAPGAQIRRDYDPVDTSDVSDPKVYLRQQSTR